MVQNKIRVRYAPSPTGHLHIGNARTALFNYLFARHYKGKFIIRIEDTDTKRNVKDGEKSQLDNLKWLGIDWDEGPDKPGDYGPYRQSERKEIYQKYIQQLLDANLAYKSYKTEEELQNEREAQRSSGIAPHYVYEYEGMSDEEIKRVQRDAEAKGIKPVVRFRVPKNKEYAWKDIVKGDISINSDTIGGDWVIQKRDGMPTYNFAVVIDDHMMEITHVLRGDDHVANTPKQLMIYEALGWQAPIFGHMTLIINTETGKKLSKRDETVLQFIEQYRELGYLSNAMFNFIALLGWSPVGENELFTQRELIKMFDEKRLSKSPAKFDGKKLEWINNQYVKNASDDEIFDSSLRALMKSNLVSSDSLDQFKIEWLRELVHLYKKQMSYTHQIVDLSKDIFFNVNKKISSEAMEELKLDTAKVVLQKFVDKIKQLPVFSAYSIQKSIKEIQKETGIKGRALYMPIRIAATKEMHGPDLANSLELFGFKKVVENIEQTINML